MSTVFPVEFEAFAADSGRSSGLLQGFTRDVSEAGLCLELKSLAAGAEIFLSQDARLDLIINPPFTKRPIKASGRIVWLSRRDEIWPPNYLIGVSYTRIDDKQKGRIVKYARRLFWAPRAAIASAAVLGVVLVALLAREQVLTSENRRLFQELITSAEKKSEIAGNLYEIQKRKTVLDTDLVQARGKIRKLESELKSARDEAPASADRRRALDDAIAQRKLITQELKGIQEERQKLQGDFASIGAPLGPRTLYKWIQSHQNLETGLVASFEGDPSLEDWAFTYDQSLAAQAFLAFGDIRNAELILDFYEQRALREGGAYYTAYDAGDGRAAEAIVITGPNLWIGLAALQHEHRLKTGKFLPMARRIGDWALSIQDAEGGLKGGHQVTWYSTEHNLDAYAFFDRLYATTDDERYRTGRDKTLAWLKKYAYTATEGRLNRGKGDATIATDTFSWAIAAIGPETLKKNGLDYEAIIDFAEKHCVVKIQYRTQSGKLITVRGFDFAKAQNIGRGGVISTEWTAQMIVSYRILARHYEATGDKDRAALYRDKAELYLAELQKLVVTSPSRVGQGHGCLPYASIDNVDTGHGWRTPKGKQTGSIAGTAYGLFAWTGYNPFDLENHVKLD